jgi:putative Holliday junction resolvase
MKALGLDLGDRWVGTALSDGMKMTCKPYETVYLEALEPFLEKLLAVEPVSVVVVGYPKTFSGGESAQTNKIVLLKNSLESRFTEVRGRAILWLLWDERLSSKRALDVQHGSSSPEAKKRSHSIAAAFILQSYLDNLAFHAVES